MKRISGLTLFLFLFIYSPGYSQMENDDIDIFFNDCKMLNILREKKDSKYSGSPYLNEKYQTGKIKFSDGKEYNNIQLRYNMYRDEFEFDKENQEYALIKSPEISEIFISKKVFVYRDYKYRDESHEGYLEQLVDGEYSLYLKHITLLRALEDIGAFSDAAESKFWPQKPAIMIGNARDGIVEIKGSKDILNEFHGLKESIVNYTGKKRLKLKSREDYIDLITYLNSKS